MPVEERTSDASSMLPEIYFRESVCQSLMVVIFEIKNAFGMLATRGKSW
jgi:hypothetical protein